jgi:oligopeptide transport system permease protein
MTATATTPTHLPPTDGSLTEPNPPTAFSAPPTAFRRSLQSGRVVVGGGILLVVVLLCVVTLPWTTADGGRFYYDLQDSATIRLPPAPPMNLWFGTDTLGRSMLGRCLLGGTISLAIGVLAAVMSVFLGVTVGLLAGYRGGWTDSVLMRLVDILYGLPYILLVILFKIALEQPMTGLIHRLTNVRGAEQISNFIVLFFAIGAVSWLTMARVVRGQVLSLRSQPFIEACKAAGLPEWRIFTRHLLPNLIGPITVYATLIVPSAILNESFLSFLGIGIQPPVPTWGSLASEGLLPALNPVNHRWWMLLFPCILLAVTLLCLNFVGDGLRDVFDPKRDSAKL